MSVPLKKEFVEMLASLPGHEGLADVLATTESPVSVRFNPAKPHKPFPDALKQVPWESQGWYLDSRPRFSFDPALYDGRYYVQDASSMIVGEAIRRIVKKTDGPIRYLDACAAPGGKTTSALANLPEGSFVLANEYESSRAHALVENLERWGATNYAVSRADARSLGAIGQAFHIVAADVPCSGEGMMRKNETARTQWSTSLVRDCSVLQRQIVEALWQTLLPGGYLIYSTCTFNTAENEENAAWIQSELGGIPVNLGLDEFPGVMPGVNTDIPCVRLLPGQVQGEGQFLAVFQKPGILKHDEWHPGKTRASKSKIPDFKLDTENLKFITDKKGDIYAVESRHAHFVERISGNTNIIIPGIHVATPKGADFMPAHALATSLALPHDAFPTVDVDTTTALSFLRGEALRLPADTPKGYVLIQSDGCRLGWVKNIGSRANNLIPTYRRLRIQS